MINPQSQQSILVSTAYYSLNCILEFILQDQQVFRRDIMHSQKESQEAS